MAYNPNHKRFPIGQLMATPNALAHIAHQDLLKGLAKHLMCDWGEVCPVDWLSNDLALEEGTRLLSVYWSGETKFWIITEADRSQTTILLPSDY